MNKIFINIIFYVVFYYFHSHLSVTNAVLRIIYPNDFNNGQVEIRHNVTFIGRPKSFGNVIGNIYAPTTNLDGCLPFDNNIINHSETYQYNTILLIQQGGCSILEKVQNAQKASAVAVMIYDINNQTIHFPLAIDDGSTTDIHIPSIFIYNNDAKNILNYLEKDNKKDIVITLISWNIPYNDNPIEWSLWSSSYDLYLNPFIKNFYYVIQALTPYIKFSPHFEVYKGNQLGCNTTNNVSCDGLCLYSNKYCMYNIESNSFSNHLNGTDILEENIRQLCIFNYTSSINQSIIYWDYLIQFNDQCRHNVINNTKSLFNKNCSEKIQKNLKLPVQTIDSCNNESGETLLKLEEENKNKHNIVHFPSIIMNNLQQNHMDISCPLPIDVTTCLPLKTICSNIQEKLRPLACSNIYWKDRCYPPKQIDACGKCLDPILEKNLWDKSCMGCDGVPNSNIKYDVCGVCGGTGSFDVCGKCLPKEDQNRDSSCKDCKGVINGNAKMDPCGVCDGHGSFDSCGLCLNEYDPRRQDIICKPTDDLDGIVLKLLLIGIRGNQFIRKILDTFKKSISKISDLESKYIIIKSVDDSGPSNTPECTVHLFLAISNSNLHENIYKKFQKQENEKYISTYMKEFAPDIPVKSVKILSARSPNQFTFENNEKNNKKMNPFMISFLFFSIIGIVSTIIFIMKKKEKEIRGEIRQMSAKYVSVSIDDDSNISTIQQNKFTKGK